VYYYERHGEREGLVITSLNGGWVRDSLYKMYLAILLLPLIGCSATMLSVICIVFTAILSTFAFFEVGLNGSPVEIQLGFWISSLYLNVEWGLVYDS